MSPVRPGRRGTSVCASISLLSLPVMTRTKSRRRGHACCCPKAGPVFGRDPRYADLVLYVEPGMAQAGKVSPAGLAVWHERFARAVRLPAVLARYLTSDLGLATSSDPSAQIAIWLKARGTSLTELVDVDGFTVVPGSQPNWL